MVKTKVQIPNELYHRAKAIAAEKKISFAEVVRRGLEHIAAVYPGSADPAWELPKPLRARLNPKLDHNQLHDLALDDEVRQAQTVETTPPRTGSV